VRKLIPLFITAAILAFSITTFADTIQGRVVSIADGDTVTVLDAFNTEHRIRLMGIDAPEMQMPFGQWSKENLSNLVFGKQVIIEYSKQDRFGRAIGKIIVNGVDVNLEQIKAGMAWHYKRDQKEQSPVDRTSYAEAEVQARARHQGLWADKEPMPPWDWRHFQRQESDERIET